MLELANQKVAGSILTVVKDFFSLEIFPLSGPVRVFFPEVLKLTKMHLDRRDTKDF